MMEPQIVFSDYIVYVDESGDHSLENLNPDYPLFVLAFCIFKKSVYCETVSTSLRRLKFQTFGHDMVVLHEHEIRKKAGAFSRLGKEAREALLTALTDIISKTEFTLIGIVIDKAKLKGQYVHPAHPYHLAMEFGLERVFRFLGDQKQSDRFTFLVFESRGKNEDEALELEFRRVRDGANYFKKSLPFEMIIADKRVNSEGLQLADMMARPIGLSVLRPGQPNRAMDILRRKFYRDRGGMVSGFGLKKFP